MRKPRNWPIGVVPIHISVYGKYLHFTTSLDDFNKAIDFMGEHEHKMQTCKAGFSKYFQGKDGQMYWFVCVADGRIETLVHELGHFCLDLIKYLGFSAHAGGGEPFCYLIDYLVQKTLPLIQSEMVEA